MRVMLRRRFSHYYSHSHHHLVQLSLSHGHHIVTATTNNSGIRMNMAARLPSEILQMIFSHVVPTEDDDITDHLSWPHGCVQEKLTALINICRACKLFNTLAQPRLFSTFSQT